MGVERAELHEECLRKRLGANQLWVIGHVVIKYQIK